MVRPKLEAARWEANGERHYKEQIHITAGRILVAGGKLSLKPPNLLHLKPPLHKTKKAARTSDR